MKDFLFILQVRNWHWLSWRVWAGTHVVLTVPWVSLPHAGGPAEGKPPGASLLGAWRARRLASAGEHTRRTRSHHLRLIWGKALHLFKPQVSHTWHEKGEGWVSHLAELSWDPQGQGSVPGTELVLARGWLWLLVSCFCWTLMCNCRHRHVLHFCLAFVVFQVEFTSSHLNFVIEQGRC